MSKVTSNILDLVEVDVSELTPFQGKLKTLSPENYQKLKNEILKTGFNFAQHVWPNEGQLYIIDGHQRKTALEMMRAEGIDIPKVKAVRVSAPDFQTAKRMVLQGVSQYGQIDVMELPKFANEAGLKVEDLNISFDLPNVNIEDILPSEMVNKVNRGDENEEWVGLPEFEPGKKEIKLTLIFKSEEERAKFAQDHKIEVTGKQSGQWSSRIGLKEEDDE